MLRRCTRYETGWFVASIFHQRRYPRHIDEIERVQYLIDRAIEKIATNDRYRALAGLSRVELRRRLLAEAHYRDIRALRAEIEAERVQAEQDAAASEESSS